MPIAATATDDAWRRLDERIGEGSASARRSSDGSVSEGTSDETIARLRSTPMTSSHTLLRLPPLTNLTDHPPLSKRSTPASLVVSKTKSRKRKMSMQDVISNSSPPSLRRIGLPHLVPSTSLLPPSTSSSATTLPPMTSSASTHHPHTKGRSKRSGRQHSAHAAGKPPSPRTASSIARLTSGKDICVVAHHGIVDWIATYFVYGFDKNSLFHLLVPLRQQQEPWSDAEVAYLTILVRLLQQGKMRLPRGKSMQTYVAEKLHAPEPRIRLQLQHLDVQSDSGTSHLPTSTGPRPAAKCVLTPAEVAELKETKTLFLRTLESAVVDALHENAIDQSCVVSIKY